MNMQSLIDNVKTADYVTIGTYALAIFAGAAVTYLGLSVAASVFTAVAGSLGGLVAFLIWMQVAVPAVYFGIGTAGITVLAAEYLRKNAPEIRDSVASKFEAAKRWATRKPATAQIFTLH